MNTKQGDGDGQIEAIFEEVLARVIFDTAIDIHKQTQISGASNIDTRPVAVDEASRVHEMGLKFSEDIYGNTKNMATHAITCDRCGRQGLRYASHLANCMGHGGRRARAAAMMMFKEKDS